jgi:DtxR family Mn-dependent transcriptional regulator
MPSITTENYLKTILQLRDKHPERDLVNLGELAQELGLTAGTITTMAKRLAKDGYLDYHIRSGVCLTETGQQEALKVVRRHRLIELFLVEKLKIDWSEVHEDAEALEHAVSDRVLDRIDAMMHYPEVDPHGAPIPSRSECMQEHS